ncbi:NDMA-dependent alcohol dehydrogenase [Amycolatopsis sp. K13G38]|uniref:NDMA-dependent alcohol dehydrogenase n=1 Tax=Amycolatopsis acididurans TaxID=2724524 RepID=A0ABX1JA37_9PSEU|nr:NDMA-dependent alcohol dehydrogenase [Amycolatopsis acididurans]NKQ56156.1 NDMA-dependent alcohol dehydrogenase [Amycolatopsis acididurans]
MKVRGAVLRSTPGEFELVELELDGPRQGELTVRVAASGLCRSDYSIAAGTHHVERLPMCCGHEGAGTVVEVGPNTPGWAVGDHVVLSALPSCGRCRMCATGRGNLCDLNASLLYGARFDDPTSYRMSLAGQPVGQWCGVSTFAEYTTVGVTSAVKIDPSVPLDRACLVGCGVNTGWGSAVNMGEVRPGDTTIVMGAGGIGSFALQGARHAGATNLIAVDPVPFKREMATTFGATHACESIAEATDLAKHLTNGQGADTTIITVGELQPAHIADAYASLRKGGICVITALGDTKHVGMDIPVYEFTVFQKRIQGSMFGGVAPMWDIRKMLSMYTAGQLLLDEVITTTYSLDEINKGYQDMLDGRNIRGVIVYP